MVSLVRKRKSARTAKKLFLRGAVLVVSLGLCIVAIDLIKREAETSAAQSRWFSEYGRKISFVMKPGAAPSIHYPKFGPYNERLGYAYLPYYIKALHADGFEIAAQAHASEAYHKLVKHGVYSIYHPKTTAGLTLYDRRGEKIYSLLYPNRAFSSFDDIPDILVDTLLYIENRELLRNSSDTHNPVIEWKRLAYAVFSQVLHKISPETNAGGGSTLAIQIEKFRFSPHGLTGNILEKLRQIASATFRVYLNGPDTREARKNIVLDYFNSTPLSARPGCGEINSIGDGLWAWFGIDLKEAQAALNLREDEQEALLRKAKIYRAALGLILAQRRPSYYLQANRAELDDLINSTLHRLKDVGIISKKLHDVALVEKLNFISEAPMPPEPLYIEQKAVNAHRTHLMNLLSLKRLYEVDRIDLSGRTTLDYSAQQKLSEFLKNTGDKSFLEARGLYGYHLLEPGNDPNKVKWSVVLYERGSDSNKIRLQADNIEGPFDMNEGMKLDLGSTAKLRTLVTYLEMIAELHRRYAGLDPESLKDMKADAPDNLTSWAIDWLSANADADLDSMLNASLGRRYSASPGEIFFTGGGQHTFHNFNRDEDFQIMDVREAFRRSVNLVFVRIMRDIVNYTISQGPQTKDDLLHHEDEHAPVRKAYLERFAEQEGGVFLNRYLLDYGGLTESARLEKLLSHAHKGAIAYTVIFRSIMPQADYSAYVRFMRSHSFLAAVPEPRLTKLYKDYAQDRYSLSDRAYLSGVNPMELWLVSYIRERPEASRHELMDASRSTRLSSYAWLFKDSKKKAQNTRIRIMLEEDAFAHILKRWQRLGYPFNHLVPSFATSIGSSADRPGALAELVGIIIADGRRMPVERFETLEFAENTPYQTLLKPNFAGKSQQVLDPSVAHVMKKVMNEVVENGTAKRASGIYRDLDGRVMQVGGKTGTGDHRYEEFGAGGRLLSSRVVNRTGTFVFYIGDHFFGAITAHVAGEDAGNYGFTSALPAQMLCALAPILNPVVNAKTPDIEEMIPPIEFNQSLPPK